MPIYEYRCDKGHSFELIQRMSDESLDSCERCGAPARRVLHPVAVHFKGSGFYNTDYGKRKKGASSESSENGGSPGEPKKESSKEPKKDSKEPASSNGSKASSD